MDNKNTTTTISTNDPSSTTAAATTTTTTAAVNNNNRDQFLRHLNKLSYKISKPTPSSSTSSKPPLEPPPPPPPLPLHPPQQQQPPVYNINKSQFRDVVQKLTGSPAHAAAPSQQPPPIHAPKPASSRLQRIRPPPLAQLGTRPPAMLNSGVNPLSPLPPLPTCHAAAESPISAYMRFLHSYGAILPPPPQAPPSDAMVPPFSYFPSPKSPCPLLSPNLGVFSPTGSGPLGFPQLPVSPTVPGVPSPKWRDL